jgi:hypothetical protein
LSGWWGSAWSRWSGCGPRWGGAPSGADRLAARVEALPPDLSRVFGNHDRHIISVELLNR